MRHALGFGFMLSQCRLIYARQAASLGLQTASKRLFTCGPYTLGRGSAQDAQFLGGVRWLNASHAYMKRMQTQQLLCLLASCNYSVA